MNKELTVYFEKKLNEAFDNDFEIYLRGDTICTNLNYHDDELIGVFNIKECEKIFPNIKLQYAGYEYPNADESGNDTMEVITLRGIAMDTITKEKIDKFCTILEKGYRYV